uniref:Uncharacterized protein n=1 Tax=Opuntia streptacantha TaxID=393608 RepID=A0A7C9CSG0_OPUST
MADVDPCPSTTLTNGQPLGKRPPTVQLVSGALGELLVLQLAKKNSSKENQFVAGAETGRGFLAEGSGVTCCRQTNPTGSPLISSNLPTGSKNSRKTEQR